MCICVHSCGNPQRPEASIEWSPGDGVLGSHESLWGWGILTSNSILLQEQQVPIHQGIFTASKMGQLSKYSPLIHMPSHWRIFYFENTTTCIKKKKKHFLRFFFLYFWVSITNLAGTAFSLPCISFLLLFKYWLIHKSFLGFFFLWNSIIKLSFHTAVCLRGLCCPSWLFQE